MLQLKSIIGKVARFRKPQQRITLLNSVVHGYLEEAVKMLQYI